MQSLLVQSAYHCSRHWRISCPQARSRPPWTGGALVNSRGWSDGYALSYFNREHSLRCLFSGLFFWILLLGQDIYFREHSGNIGILANTKWDILKYWGLQIMFLNIGSMNRPKLTVLTDMEISLFFLHYIVPKWVQKWKTQVYLRGLFCVKL